MALGTAVGFKPLLETAQRSRVVLVRRQDVLDDDFAINGKSVQIMLDDAVKALFQVNDPVVAFRKFIDPADVVGIKSNEWNYLPTPAELEHAIRRRVLDAGVRQENVAVDDRGVRENPVFQKATVLINARPLRTHHLAGMSGCLKNLIMFDKDQSAWHPNNCINLGLLLHLPMVKGKVRLHVLSLLTPQFRVGVQGIAGGYRSGGRGRCGPEDSDCQEEGAFRLPLPDTAPAAIHRNRRYQARPGERRSRENRIDQARVGRRNLDLVFITGSFGRKTHEANDSLFG
jgi:hypothetical protein